jgi:TolA-binding protein
MIRIRKTVASVLGALLVLGTCAAASAQANEPPATGTSKEPKQAQFDRDKVTLKDQVQDAINSADSHIDALKKMESTDKDAAQKRDKDIGKKLSDLKDGLQKDLDKIDKASPSDWATVRAGVEGNLRAMHTELKTAANVTHVAPSTGAANKQPTNPPSTPKP